MPRAVARVVILGCGYAGRALARRLIARGEPGRATTTSSSKITSLRDLGADVVFLDRERRDSYRAALSEATAVVHLAPPPQHESIEEEVDRVVRSLGDRLEAYVYGSTTGVFGNADGGQWIDESTPPRDPAEKGRVRLEYERALAAAKVPLKVVRIAGIYGPGRTLRESLAKQSLLLFEGGPPTSRIHVEDLARLLEAMARPSSPPLAIACDELPAPTLDVARYTCELLGIEAPAPVALEDAKRVLSPAAIEMRLGGRRCRSLVREKLIGPLDHPTYREGVKASLIAEGALRV
jgi:nucleoside-diphosphate-sugar epimerase